MFEEKVINHFIYTAKYKKDKLIVLKKMFDTFNCVINDTIKQCHCHRHNHKS